jgi:hypothetical protein
LHLIVVVPKKNKKFRICMDFQKLNIATKNDPYPLPCTKKILNMVARHEIYSFLHDFFNQFMITLENKYKIAFITNWETFV